MENYPQERTGIYSPGYRTSQEKQQDPYSLSRIISSSRTALTFGLLAASLIACKATKAEMKFRKEPQINMLTQEEASQAELNELIERVLCKSFDDPESNLEYLEEKEVVLPNDVFNAYAKIVDPKLHHAPKWLLNTLRGGYIDTNRMKDSGSKRAFFKDLKTAYSKEQIEGYMQILSSGDVIIFPERALKSDDFTRFLAHERMHKYHQQLTDQENQILFETVKKLMTAKNEDGSLVIEDSNERCQIEDNWRECLPYIMDGRFSVRTPFGEKGPVEKELMKHPEAYQIFSKLRHQSEEDIKNLRIQKYKRKIVKASKK